MWSAIEVPRIPRCNQSIFFCHVSPMYRDPEGSPYGREINRWKGENGDSSYPSHAGMSLLLTEEIHDPIVPSEAGYTVALRFNL